MRAARLPKASKAKPEKPVKSRMFVQVRKMRKQEGCEEGQVAFFCSACMKKFCVPAGETPDACPEGHPAEVEDEFGSLVVDAAAKED